MRPNDGERGHRTKTVDRRDYLKAVAAAGGAGLAGCAGGSSGDGGGSVEELSLLTWNISFIEESIMGWIEDFQAMDEYSDVEVNHTDKPGPDLPTYFQNQIQAGTPPHVADTQGAVYSRYANDGVFEPLDKYTDEEFMDRFGEKSIEFSRLGEDLFRFPFYQQTNTTYFREKFFEEAGIEPPTVDDPYSAFEYLDVAEQLVENSEAEFGLTMHRFDYMFWTFFWAEGVDILNEDQTEAAFNTSTAADLLTRFQELTDAGVIPDLTWTGRWEEQNQQFGAGETAMHMSQQAALRPIQNFGSEWVSADTLGIAHAPENTGYYSAHGLSITSSEHSDAEKQAAFDLISVILNDKWQEDFLRKTTVMAGNLTPQEKLADDEDFRSENTLLAELYDLWFAVQDDLIIPPQVPASGSIQSIIDTEIGAGALGEKSPEEALDAAERQVNQELSDSG